MQSAVVDATRRLAAAGVPSPRVDAELLAAHALGTGRGTLARARTFPPGALATFRDLVRRRAERVPLQYLLGTVPFAGVEVAVGPGVFVPRPETELLAEWAIDTLAGLDAPAPVVLDLCAGSGALALAVAHAHPRARVAAVEQDPAAVVWLARNAAGTPVRVLAADATDPAVLADLAGVVDLVVSNPPYLPTGRAGELEPEVGHDPAVALYGGTDGLAVVRPLLAVAALLVRPGGWLGLEHDDTQGSAVPELLTAAGAWTDITDHPDLAGRPRFTTARRATTPG